MNGPGAGRLPPGPVQEAAKGGPANHAMLYIEDNETTSCWLKGCSGAGRESSCTSP